MIAFALVPAASTSIFPAITPKVVATCSGVNPSFSIPRLSASLRGEAGVSPRR
jgi:hypothetical protein